MEDAAKKTATAQNTMQVWDGSAASKEKRKASQGWEGLHVLFTEKTQIQIVLESMKKKLLISYGGTLAFLVFFTVMLGGNCEFCEVNFAQRGSAASLWNAEQ